MSAPHTWRSILFVPSLSPAMIGKAQMRGADAIQLDLEDAIAEDRKEEARRAIPEAIASLAAGPGDVLVRINRPWRHAVRDLEACVRPGVSAVTLPKPSGAEDIAVVAEILDDLESVHGVAPGSIRIIAQVETAAGLLAMGRATGFPKRLMALTIGPEDFSRDLGVDPTPGNLHEPLRTCVLIARGAGIQALGFARTIGDFENLDALRDAVGAAYALGLRGAFCVHPSQVPILNQHFRPSAAAVQNARMIVARFEEARELGESVFSIDGQMIDLPVYERAKALLRDAHSS